jgi:thioredoxin-dependent peroxiredoxin
MALNLNQPAYQFTLKNSNNNDVSLSDYLGKKVMLVFYPRDNSLVCTKQLCEYNNFLNEFEDLGVAVLAISKDSVDKHKKFRDSRNLKIELLSDEDASVCRKYGMLNFMGIAKRGICLIDEKGIIKANDVTIPLNYQKKDYLKKLIEEAYN